MRRRPSLRCIATLIGLAASGAAAAEKGMVSCHIHPPGSTPERPVGIIGPFATPRTCESERMARFSADGRCHCQADFSPGWLPVVPEEGGRPPDELL